METSTIQKWDRRSCTATAFYSLIDPEDWVKAFGEMVLGLEAHYGLKISSLESRITYWNYNKQDKVASLSELMVGIGEGTSTFNNLTLERWQGYFWSAAEEAQRQLRVNLHPPTQDLLFQASVKAFAESACKAEGWEPTEEHIGEFCHAILMKWSQHDAGVSDFFDSLSWLSRSLVYEVKEREPLPSLDENGIIQGIFEATHWMCLSQGGYLFSLNHLLNDVDEVFYFHREEAESRKSLDSICSLYRSNWKIIRDRIQNGMEPEDYEHLQTWVKDCRLQIEQALKHQENVCLRDICGQRQFVFTEAYQQHSAIALFIDILNNDLLGLDLAKRQSIADPEQAHNEQRTLVIEYQQEAERRRQAIKQIVQNKVEAFEAYESAIAINAHIICDLRTQNDWRFEAWRLFVACFSTASDLGAGQSWPLFYFCNADEIVLQEMDAHVTRNPFHSQTYLMWKCYGGFEASSLNAWIEDTLERLKIAANMNSTRHVVEIAKPIFDGKEVPILGSPPRWGLYAALFERLLLDPPEWIKALPEKRQQIPSGQVRTEESAIRENSANPKKLVQPSPQTATLVGYYNITLAIYEKAHGKTEKVFIIQEKDGSHQREGGETLQWLKEKGYESLLGFLSKSSKSASPQTPKPSSQTVRQPEGDDDHKRNWEIIASRLQPADAQLLKVFKQHPSKRFSKLAAIAMAWNGSQVSRQAFYNARTRIKETFGFEVIDYSKKTSDYGLSPECGA